MNKIAVVMVVLLVSSTASATEEECSSGERFKRIATGAAIGLGVGAVMGAVAAATMPVAAVGGPMAISHFMWGAGRANLGAWLANGVAPMTLTGAVMGGMLGTAAGAIRGC